jgi:membrane protein YdbS with pleckstrin-like domain
MTYKASYDTTVKILSTLITGAIAVIAVSYLINIFQAAMQGVAISAYAGKIILVFLLVGLVLFVFLFSVKNYAIENNSLHINRWLNKVIIPFAEIKTVRVVTDADMGLVFRTFGVGGLFGYLGKFSSSKLGSLTYYATQNKNRVFIEMHDGKKLLITPDDLALAEQLNAK